MRRVINLFKLSIFSLIVTTILTFTIFGSTISATEKKISNNVIAKSESAIRFDGIYQAVTKRGYNYQVSMYIRFYRVLSVSMHKSKKS
jgi:hypothetical protein